MRRALGSVEAPWLASAVTAGLAGCAPDYAPAAPIPLAFDGQVVQRFDFESGEAGAWSRFKLPWPGALTIAAEEGSSGNRFARFRLRRDDPIVFDGHRCELQLDAIGLAGEPDESWWGFRVRLPADWELDSEYEVVAQWMGMDDKPEEASKSPCLARASASAWGTSPTAGTSAGSRLTTSPQTKCCGAQRSTSAAGPSGPCKRAGATARTACCASGRTARRSSSSAGRTRSTIRAG